MKKSTKDILMKKNLGKIVFLLLLIQTMLLSNQLATYKLSTDKQSLMLKEPLIITFTVEQKDKTDNMFFSFTPKKNKDYEMRLLKSLNDDTQKHSAKAIFTYVLFPLKAKKIVVHFNFILQTASDGALAQSYVDDHDGSKAIQKVSHHILLKPLTIEVNKTPKNIDFFGDFTLKAKLDKTVVSAYEDVNLIYTLQGQGYKNEKKSLLPKITKVTSFNDAHNIYAKLTKKGYSTKRVYTYALSATEDFTIPAQNLRAYSFTKHKLYTLQTPSYMVHVRKINPKYLLDKVDAPKQKIWLNMESIKKYFIYSMIFLFGFLSAKLTEFNFIRKEKEDKFQDIKKTKTAKELLLVLINNYRNSEIKDFVEKLEMIEYKQSSQSFQEVKKEILGVFK